MSAHSKLLPSEKRAIRDKALAVLEIAQGFALVEQTFNSGHHDLAVDMLRKFLKAVPQASISERFIILMQGEMGRFIERYWQEPKQVSEGDVLEKWTMWLKE